MSPVSPTFSSKELRSGKNLGYEGSARSIKVTDSMVVKTGYSVRASEAEAMKLVRARTSVPVPKIYNVYKGENELTHIVMDYVEGKNLEEAWDTLSEGQKRSIRAQLARHLSEIRSIKGEFIGCVDGSPCIDQIFTDDEHGYGPFKSELEFNRGIVKALKSSEQSAWVETVSDMITENLCGHDIVLTHSDFAPSNVIIRGTQVAGILDWEMSGFYPEYWKYIKALYRPDWRSGWIQERSIEKIMRSYNVELAILLQTRDIVWRRENLRTDVRTSC